MNHKPDLHKTADVFFQKSLWYITMQYKCVYKIYLFYTLMPLTNYSDSIH